MKVRFSYLKEKFSQHMFYKVADSQWQNVVREGDFTLGKTVREFEEKFAKLMGAKYAIGVANGTDALELSLWAAGVRAGDEVIVPANTFVASLGAVGNLQATPALVDIGDDYVMDPRKIEAAITDKTKAIIPVHFCGNPVDMDAVMKVANKHNLAVIEDACQAYLAEYKGKCVGTFGFTGAFSLHPLKILNVMGDGGMITTNDEKTYIELKLLQNHGLFDRDTITRFPCRNSRLDSMQAVAGLLQIDDTPLNVRRRRENASYYDEKLGSTVYIPKRDADKKSCYHLYFIEVQSEVRDGLYKYLNDSGVECKVHYKTPLYLQPALKETLGHSKGDFPISDITCDRIITLPVDENVTREMQDYVILKIKEYVDGRKSDAI